MLSAVVVSTGFSISGFHLVNHTTSGSDGFQQDSLTTCRCCCFDSERQPWASTACWKHWAIVEDSKMGKQSFSWFMVLWHWNDDDRNAIQVIGTALLPFTQPRAKCCRMIRQQKQQLLHLMTPRRRRLSPRKLHYSSRKCIRKRIVLLLGIILLWIYVCNVAVFYQTHQTVVKSSARPCAILIYGLPRSFHNLVLPSMIPNVLKPNLACDFFVHYYDIQSEEAGRSGDGGAIRAKDIYLLEREILKLANEAGMSVPTVRFVSDTADSFQYQYHDLLDKLMTTKDPKTGKPYYLPWKDESYDTGTVVNVMKMWHSMQSAWQAMTATSKNYETVAVIRSDVVFLSPLPATSHLSPNSIVMAAFALYPVNDRYVVGPYSAVKVWAAERFQRMEAHVANHAGHGLHSELFVHDTLLPAMREASSADIVQDSSICFVRARADATVWINDCERKRFNPLRNIANDYGLFTNTWRTQLEAALGQKCLDKPWEHLPSSWRVHVLNCSNIKLLSNKSNSWRHLVISSGEEEKRSCLEAP